MTVRAGRFVLLVSALLLALQTVGVGTASAQPAPKDDEAAAKAAPKASKARRAEPPPKVIALEGDEIVGKVPKPQVFYVLGRSPSRYRGLDVRRSFVHKIVESLKRNPL